MAQYEIHVVTSLRRMVEADDVNAANALALAMAGRIKGRVVSVYREDLIPYDDETPPKGKPPTSPPSGNTTPPQLTHAA